MKLNISIKQKLKPYLLASPAALILFLLILFPTILLILFSLHPDAPHSEHIWTLENYKFVFFENPLFYKVFFKTVMLSLFTVVFSLIICFPVAYYIAKIAKKENKLLLLLLVIAPSMVSGFIIILSWILALADYGFFYHILRYLKLVEKPLNILYTSKAVAIGLIYSSILWMFIPLYAVLDSLDNSLLEAASDLGANKFRVLVRIIIPYAKTAIGTGCTLTFLQSLGNYATPRFLGGKTGLTYIQLVFDSFYSSYNWNRGAVLALFMVIIMVVAVLIGIKSTGSNVKDIIKN